MSNPGSWTIGGYNLPDYRITETIAGALGLNQNNLVPDNVQNAAKTAVNAYVPLATNVNFSSPRPVLGVSDTATAPAGGEQNGPFLPPGYQFPTNNTTTNNTTTSTNTNTNTSVPSIDPLLAEIENLFNPSMNVLGQAESKLRGDFPTVQQDIQGQYNVGLSTLNNQRSEANRQFGEAETSSQQRESDVISAARRLYNELALGGQQRFGGATSAGQAFGELNSREFQRNSAQARQQATIALQQIQSQRQTARERFDTAMLTLETKKNEAMNQARRDFENKLTEIDRMRAGLQENKANLRLQALQELRNQVFQINLQENQLRHTLSAQQQAQEQELSSAEQVWAKTVSGAQEANQNLLDSTTVNPETSMVIGGGRPMANAAQYTGIRRPEEEMMGAINPLQRRDQFNPFV